MAHLFNAIFGNSRQSSAASNRMPGGYSNDEGRGQGMGPMGGTPNHMRSINGPVTSPQAAPCVSIDHVEHDEASEREDLLDQHVAYYLKHHPEVHAKHNLSRIRPGVYNYDGREISVEWYYSDDPDQPGYLIAIDGPLRQPFSDYMQDNENGIEYDDKRFRKSALSQIPKGKRMSFGDGNKVYSRLEAMKVAKEQALVRERAADFVKDGMPVPQQELMTKYKKTLSQKLGTRQRRPEPEAEAQAPPVQPVAEAPVACAPAPPPQSAAPSAPPATQKKQQTHGAPKYCSKHDKSEKRKKTKPQNLPCSSCGQVIQTNYVEFTLCPTCSEKDHRCMCCGAAAVGAPSAPHQQAPSSPMNARASAEQSTKSPAKEASSGAPPLTLFGMPDLFGAKEPQSGGPPSLQVAGGVRQGVQQGWPASIVTPQNNAFASQRPMTAPQNAYAPQNAFASYNPLASQNMMVGRR